MNIRELMRPHLQKVNPYVPGKPIEELRREKNIGGEIIKLASNENPLGPSPRALAAALGQFPIPRAALLGLVEGCWELMPSAEVWHIGIYRDEKTLKPVEYYNKLPTEPTVSVCLVLDPMLATGGSAVATVDVLKRWGVNRIKFVGLIGAPEGVAQLQKHHPDVPIYLAALDDHLNEVGYIVPGLGDAGDRQFGTG